MLLMPLVNLSLEKMLILSWKKFYLDKIRLKPNITPFWERMSDMLLVNPDFRKGSHFLLTYQIGK